jgi:hypothetical protein
MAAITFGPYFSTLSVSAIDKAEVRDNGGDVVALTGEFLDADHTVAIDTPTGEVPCYMGASGEGYAGSPVSPTCLTFVSPPLPLGGTYDVIVRVSGQTDTGSVVISARNRSFGQTDYGFRQMFPSVLKGGPRNLDVTDPLAT